MLIFEPGAPQILVSVFDSQKPGKASAHSLTVYYFTNSWAVYIILYIYIYIISIFYIYIYLNSIYIYTSSIYIYVFIYIYIYHCIYIPGTPYDQFFSVIWPNTAEFGETTIFFGHMPIFGSIWRQVACLKNIEKYWNDIEKTLKSCKIWQYWKDIEKILQNIEKYSKMLKNIENIQETHWKIFVSWFSPHACNLEFEILAYMPYDQLNGHMRNERKYSRLGVQVYISHIYT